jgi:hypothetical protein
VRRRRWLKPLVLVVVVAFLVPVLAQIAGGVRERSESAKSTEIRCQELSDRLSDVLGDFVSEFDGVDVLRAEQLPPLPSIPELRTESKLVRDRLSGEGCDLRAVADGVRERSAARKPRGLLANVVGRTVVANVVHVLEGEPAAKRTKRLQPADDLGEVTSGLPAGSVVRLPAGEVRVDEPVVLLQDIRLVGEGRDDTRIVSSARGAAVVLTAPGTAAFEDLSVAHEGDSSASLLLARSGTMKLHGVHLTGASLGGRSPSDRPDDPLIGGSGIVLDGGDELSVTASQITDNDVAGVLVSGSARPALSDVTITGSDTCGMCFLGGAAGTVTSSTISDNGVGVLVTDRAAPTFEATRISDNTRAGVVAQERSHPVLRDVVLASNGPQGVAAFGTASPSLLDSVVTGHGESGVASDVGRAASPEIRGNTFRDNSKAAMAFIGAGKARVSGNRCSGGRYEIVLSGTVTPTLGDNRCDVLDQR